MNAKNRDVAEKICCPSETGWKSGARRSRNPRESGISRAIVRMYSISAACNPDGRIRGFQHLLHAVDVVGMRMGERGRWPIFEIESPRSLRIRLHIPGGIDHRCSTGFPGSQEGIPGSIIGPSSAAG